MKHLLLLAVFCILFQPLHAGTFSQKFEVNGFYYAVSSPNKSVGNTVAIKTRGLKGGDFPITKSVEGLVTKAEVADFNGDKVPELFIYTTRPGSGSYGKAYAWASNRQKSLTAIFITEPSKKVLSGYLGHDEFAVIENSFVRRFPLYQTGDSNAAPHGGWRQIQYVLESGEAGWVLRIKRVDSF